MNLAGVIAANAASAPDKTAIRFEGRTWSYREFGGRIEAAAARLAGEHGVRRGDRVAVLALNDPDTLVLLYACARLGAMLCPLNWRLAPAELAYMLDHSAPKLLAVDPAFMEVAEGLAARSGLRLLPLADIPAGSHEGPSPPLGDLSDPLLCVYTSGTTGRPKGAVLTQDALAWNAVMSGHMHDMTSADHVLTVLPFFHVGGLNIQTTPALQAGAMVTIHPRFDPGATLAAIAADRPTLTVLVPATMQALIEHPDWDSTDLSSLRAVTTGSTYVPRPLIDAFERRGVPVLQVYGSTETCPVAIYTRLGGERDRPGSTGWPGLFSDAKVVGEDGTELPAGRSGEVLVRGPQVFSGYWRDEAATREALVDGWFRTGDVATRDPDGAFTVHDRKKNVIISGGENIYPAEIERVLLTHPAVAEACVVGRPDPRWDEVPVAHVVLRPGAACGEADLAAHVRAELARFKAPRAFLFVGGLPKSALGKVQHHLVRASSRDDGERSP